MIERHRNADGTYDGAAAMGELTGLGKPAVLALWDDVRANQDRLAGCRRHDFAPAAKAAPLARRVCRACGGWADSSAVRWYERGLAHAGSAA